MLIADVVEAFHDLHIVFFTAAIEEKGSACYVEDLKSRNKVRIACKELPVRRLVL